MIDAPLALAFTAGAVAAFNPCGFALLPAYLTYFLGLEEGEAPAAPLTRAGRAVGVGASVTVGFVAVFAATGIVLTGVTRTVQDWAPWAGMGLGLLLAGVGVAMLAGLQPKVPGLGRLAGRRVDGRGHASMAAFGASYATVSLSCTLPVFLAAVATTFDDTSLASGLAAFVAYALGMGLVLMVLTVAVALARETLVARLRGVLRHVGRISGGLLVVAGLYVAYYGYYEIQIDRGGPVATGPVDLVTGWSGRISTWVDSVGAGRLAVAALVTLVLLVAASAAATRRRRRRRGPDDRQGREQREQAVRVS